MVINASFVAPPAITYNSAGSAVTIVPSYETVFTHSQKTDCPITSCSLKEPLCGTGALATQTFVVLGAAPYMITS